MSDSYTAWCEENERNARIFSRENIDSVKSSSTFSRMLAKAEDACKNAKLCKAKTCANCKNIHYINRNNVCSKLGRIISDYDMTSTCKYWKGTSGKERSVMPNEDAIAWSIIWKNRFEFDK